MKYGVGRWVQILDTGLLPGKLIQQLNGQTQRLLGQQSLAGDRYLQRSQHLPWPVPVIKANLLPAAYTGLQVDIDRIRTDNELKTQAERKGGLIIWSGRKSQVAWEPRPHKWTLTHLNSAANPTKKMKDEWRVEGQAKYAPSLSLAYL